MPPRDGHKDVYQESDEYVCRACRKRWDVNDREVPVCEPYTIKVNPVYRGSSYADRKAERKARRTR